MALHKKSSVHNLNKYRPVSLTSLMCKLYEKLIREYILDRIEAVLSDKQHCFMRGRSCLSHLLETMDAVKGAGGSPTENIILCYFCRGQAELPDAFYQIKKY